MCVTFFLKDLLSWIFSTSFENLQQQLFRKFAHSHGMTHKSAAINTGWDKYKLWVHTKDRLRSSCTLYAYFFFFFFFFEIWNSSLLICCLFISVHCNWLQKFQHDLQVAGDLLLNSLSQYFHLKSFPRTSDLFSVAMFNISCSQNEAEDMCCHGNTCKWHTVPLVTVTREKSSQIKEQPLNDFLDNGSVSLKTGSDSSMSARDHPFVNIRTQSMVSNIPMRTMPVFIKYDHRPPLP